MLEVFLDALKDSAILLGIIFLLHVLLSFFEGKVARILERSRKYGPAMGALFGVVPECGTSVVGADLYLKGHLTMGTLVAIFLACSDEALPILFSDVTGKWWMGFVLLGFKILIGMGVGFLVDLLYRHANEVMIHLHKCTGEEASHVGCCGHEVEETSPWKEHLLHPLVHSLKIFAYVFVIYMAFGTLVHFVGEANIAAFVSNNKYLTPLFALLVGLIPNCVSSVLLSSLFLEGALPFGALLSGLLVNAGLGMFVLLKDKKKRKDALLILAISAGTSLVFGYLALLLPF